MSEQPTRQDVHARADELTSAANRIGRHFARGKPRQRARGYVRGLLSDTQRKK